MSEKRKRDTGDRATGQEAAPKRAKKGFQVGPANLPDGIYKRKNQKIKESLIERAQIKKKYAKVKRHDEADVRDRIPVPASMQQESAASGNEGEEEPGLDSHAPTTEPHPDRQGLMDKTDEQVAEDEGNAEQPNPNGWKRQRKPKSVPFQREYEQAQQRKAEAEQRRAAREEAERQRQRKIEERERFRKAMAKARTGGKNGQRKLGRESTVLLEKVKRMVDGGG